jgi:hypothetical protein
MENVSEIITGLAEEMSSEAVEEIASEAAGFLSGFGNWDNVMESLKIMGLGMIGIFAVTAVIVVLVTLLNKSTSREKKKED